MIAYRLRGNRTVEFVKDDERASFSGHAYNNNDIIYMLVLDSSRSQAHSLDFVFQNRDIDKCGMQQWTDHSTGFHSTDLQINRICRPM